MYCIEPTSLDLKEPNVQRIMFQYVRCDSLPVYYGLHRCRSNYGQTRPGHSTITYGPRLVRVRDHDLKTLWSNGCICHDFDSVLCHTTINLSIRDNPFAANSSITSVPTHTLSSASRTGFLLLVRSNNNPAFDTRHRRRILVVVCESRNNELVRTFGILSADFNDLEECKHISPTTVTVSMASC